MKIATKILSFTLAMITLFFAAPIAQVIGLGGEELAMETGATDLNIEYAMFPMDVLKISRTNTKLDADQKKIADPEGGHVKFAWDLAGSDTTAVAPFDATVVSIDTSSKTNHSVVIQSNNKVKLANGKEDYVTCMFTHDDELNSNVKKGAVLKQGEYFYDQGTFGNGKKGTYDRHLHLEIAVGRVAEPKDAQKKSFGTFREYVRGKNGRQAYEVFFLTSKTNRQRDYIQIVCQNNKKVTFNWKVADTVTFDGMGATVSPATQRYTVGATYGTLPTPKRQYFNFLGWYTDRTGGTQVKNTTNVTAGDKTLYARWAVVHQSNTYLIAYDSNGGTGYGIPTVAVKEKKFTLTTNKFVKKGYVLKGFTVKRKSDNKWYVAGKGWVSASTINLFKYTKKVYAPGTTMNFSSSWYKGAKKNDTYIFYASWKTCTHKWDAGKITKAATTVNEGVKTFTCTACTQTKTQAVAKLTKDNYFSKVYSTNITATNAKIGGDFKALTKVKTAGFYIGTNKNSMTRVSKNLKGKADGAGKFKSVYYTLSEWYGPLKPGTTYYYAVYYIDSKGNECVSAIKSFKTASLTAKWSGYGASGITKTNAKIKATVKLSNSVKQEKCGFYIGTSQSNMKKASKFDTINKTRATTNMSYDLTKYGQKLKANTTYYYQFYVVAAGKEYKSAVKSFKTSK